LRYPLVPLVQIPDPIFELIILPLRKQADDLISTSGGILVALGGLVVYRFSDAEFAR
jgi:hypothetical protein